MLAERPLRILCVSAHPDDLEIMAGGAVAKWIGDGHQVHVLNLTNGSWKGPDGKVRRKARDAAREARAAAAYLGYTVEHLGIPAMHLSFQDSLVCEVLQRIETRGCDLLVCPWERDLHHDHEIASRIALSASRRVPRVLMGQLNHHLRDVFTPNVFVDISQTWPRKLEALKRYTSEWERTGQDWYGFLDETTRYYGRLVGVERAEGFLSTKLLY